MRKPLSRTDRSRGRVRGRADERRGLFGRRGRSSIPGLRIVANSGIDVGIGIEPKREVEVGGQFEHYREGTYFQDISFGLLPRPSSLRSGRALV